MNTRVNTRPGGMVLIGLLVLLALAGAALATIAQAAAAARQREAEQELLFIGRQYRDAIESYYRHTPGPIKTLPLKLADLVEDPRFPQPMRHLRKLYADPLAPEVPWGIVRLQGQIIGVYSQAEGQPFRTQGFEPGFESFNGARSYADWRFLWVPARQTGPRSADDLPTTHTAPAVPAKENTR